MLWAAACPRARRAACAAHAAGRRRPAHAPRAARRARRHTYEGLAEWAGGARWRVGTQAALLMLLWGTLCAGLALIGDVAGARARCPGAELPAAPAKDP